MSQQLLTCLAKFAKVDMKMAREDGAITIVDTKHGNIMLKYNRDQKDYTVLGEGWEIDGKAAKIKEFLMNNYQIITEGG